MEEGIWGTALSSTFCKVQFDSFGLGSMRANGSATTSRKEESRRLETFLEEIEQRAYALVLSASKAEWVLSLNTQHFICDEPPSELPLTPPPTPPFSNQTLPSVAKNRRKKMQRKARRSVSENGGDSCCPEENQVSRHLTTGDRLSSLRQYLRTPNDLPSSISASIWHTLVSDIFRYVILRTPSLAPLALDESNRDPNMNVERFLDLLEERSGERCGAEIDKLWAGLKFSTTPSTDPRGALLGLSVLADCIANGFKQSVEPGEGILILGGTIYNDVLRSDVPRQGWELFHQFVSCRSGVLPLCCFTDTRSFLDLLCWMRRTGSL